MTTRRRQSDGSGQPGTRAWRNTLQAIKRELDADNGRIIRKLEEQDAEWAEQIRPLTELAESLRVEELLSYMNDTLLDGQGVVETVFRWVEVEALEEENEDDEDEDDDHEEDDDWDDELEDDDEEDLDEDEAFDLAVTLSVTLFWKQAGRLQVSVVIQEEQDEDEIELRVNGMPIAPPTARNLQSGLVEAFRERMDVDFGQEDDEDE